MKMVKLGEVSKFVRGITFKPGDVEDAGPENVGCLRTKNVQAELDLRDVLSVPTRLVKRQEQYVQHGDVLISSANSWNLVGKCSWIPALDRPTSFGGFVTLLRANRSLVDARYLYHWFSSDRTQRVMRSFGSQTTNIANLNLKRAGDTELPLPSSDEQRRIAEILDKADALRAQRRQTIAHLETLAQSIFHEMFGTPTESAGGEELGEILSSIDSGTSPVAEDRSARPDEWGVLKVSAVTSQTFIESENKALMASAPVVRNEVRAGDVLFTRKNTPNLVAAVAIVRTTRPRLLIPDLVFRLNIADRERLHPEYLQAVLSNPAKRSSIQRLSGGSAASMSNISKAKLAKVKIPVPAFSLQQTFATRIAAVERLKEQHQRHLTELDTLFASLQHRAFTGQL